jgi:archaellum component FlaC
MDKGQLKQLKYLKNEIEILKKQIEDLDYTITADSVKGSNPYFPYEERNFTITGINYGEHNKKTQRLKRKLNRKVEELIDLVEETYEYIDNIDDSLIRQIITLRYVNGLAWEQVAASIGGNNTADSVRKIAERFLK